MFRMFDIYSRVIDVNQRRAELPDTKIADAIKLILNCYSNDGLKAAPNAIDFNLAEIRCAYLYLYCTSHCHLIYNSLSCFRMESERELFQWLWERQGCTKNLLSIGGGPGSDLIGLLLFLQPFISNDVISCLVVDAYSGWCDIVKDSMETLEMHRHFRQLDVRYKEVDLLKRLTDEMVQILKSTDFVTISKFVSAISADITAARRLRVMLQTLRPGTLVFFVDNAGGAAFRLGERVACSSGLVPVWGPVYHYEFRVPKNMEPMEDVLANPRFGGVRPQTSSKVSLVVWKKVDVGARGLKRTLSIVDRQVLYVDGNFGPPGGCRPTLVARRRRCAPPPEERGPYDLRRTPERINRHRRVASEYQQQRQNVNNMVMNHSHHWFQTANRYNFRSTPERRHRRVVTAPAGINEWQHWSTVEGHEFDNTNARRSENALHVRMREPLSLTHETQHQVYTPALHPPVMGIFANVEKSDLSAERRRNVSDKENRSTATPYRLRNLNPRATSSSTSTSGPVAKRMRF